MKILTCSSLIFFSLFLFSVLASSTENAFKSAARDIEANDFFSEAENTSSKTVATWPIIKPEKYVKYLLPKVRIFSFLQFAVTQLASQVIWMAIFVSTIILDPEALPDWTIELIFSSMLAGFLTGILGILVYAKYYL